MTQKTQPQSFGILERFAGKVRTAGASGHIFIEAGAALAALNLDQRRALQNGTVGADTLAAWARSIARDAVLDRGLVPARWTAVVICRRCGPVWLPDSAGPEVPYCHWCRLTATETWFPRPDVMCCECRHFIPDKVNPPGGLGNCQTAGRREGLNFPYMQEPCKAWRAREGSANGLEIRT